MSKSLDGNDCGNGVLWLCLFAEYHSRCWCSLWLICQNVLGLSCSFNRLLVWYLLNFTLNEDQLRIFLCRSIVCWFGFHHYCLGKGSISISLLLIICLLILVSPNFPVADWFGLCWRVLPKVKILLKNKHRCYIGLL